MSIKNKISDLNDRGVSPVIGVIFMVSAVVIITASIGVTVMGTADDVSDPAPQVVFDMEPTDDGVEITHAHGDTLDGDNIKLDGDVTTNTISEWSGETVTTGDSAIIGTNEGDLEIIWVGEDETDSFVLASMSVPNTETIIEIDEIYDGGQHSSSLTFTAGQISNTAGQSDTVYVDVENGGSGEISSEEEISLDKDPDHYAYSGTHHISIYETPSEENKILDCSVQKGGTWFSQTWDTPCSV